MGRPDAMHRSALHVLHLVDRASPGAHAFRRFAGGDLELFFSDEGLEPPAELRLELAGLRKKHISVYEGYSWLLKDDLH